MSKPCPCNGCKQRVPGCHAGCLEYSGWKSDVDAERAEHKKAKDKSDLVRGYQSDVALKYRKKEKKAKKVFHGH